MLAKLPSLADGSPDGPVEDEVRLHGGGPIQHHNQPWRGTRFTFVFKPREVEKVPENAIGFEVVCVFPHLHGKCRKRSHFAAHGGREKLERTEM